MELLTKDKFMKQFNSKKNNISFDEFLQKAKVKNKSRIVSLVDYMKKNNRTKQQLKHLYEHIQSKNKYLERFYNTSLKPQHLSITEKPSPTYNNNQLVNYKNIIRNLHYEEILKHTQSGFSGNPTFLETLENLYLKLIIDYKLLTPSALHYIEQNRIGGVFSSFYFRASIMNPYLVYSLNKTLLHGTRIFTPTLGWTSYLYGFLECDEVESYVGVDVIHSVCEKSRQFALQYDKQVSIIESPSENLYKNQNFKKKYKEYFDVVFFSPPYYQLELYRGDNQSTNKYNTLESWLKNYWETTIMLCKHVLAKNGRLCYIISNYDKNETMELVDRMNSIVEKHLDFKKSFSMVNKNAHMTKHRNTNEQIILFTK